MPRVMTPPLRAKLPIRLAPADLHCVVRVDWERARDDEDAHGERDHHHRKGQHAKLGRPEKEG